LAVNVNITTDVQHQCSALFLPAQDAHTLHDPSVKRAAGKSLGMRATRHALATFVEI